MRDDEIWRKACSSLRRKYLYCFEDTRLGKSGVREYVRTGICRGLIVRVDEVWGRGVVAASD